MRKTTDGIAAAWPPEPDDPIARITSAHDPNLDPHYGAAPQGQVILGRHSFKAQRDEMNTRRREMARRIERT